MASADRERDAHEAEPAAAPAPAPVAPAPAGASMAAGAGLGSSLERFDPPSRARSLTHLQRTQGNSAVARAVAGDAEPPKAAAQGLIVDDAAATVEPQQLKKGVVLAQLRTATGAAVEAAMAGSFWSALARPKVAEELEQRHAALAAKDAAGLEAALRQEAAGAAGAKSAAELIAAVAQEAGREVAARLAGEQAPADGASLRDFASGAGSLASRIGGILFKRRGDGTGGADPVAVRSELGRGEALPSSSAAAMSRAFGGEDFSGVRVHTDPGAAGAAERLDARAFTIGPDVAFGPGEFRPGTLEGDALIAHELAHVVQQRGAAAAVDAARTDGANEGALEAEADAAAVAAVTGLHGHAGRTGAGGLLARMRSGLRLQRCGKSHGDSIVKTMGSANKRDGTASVWYWPEYRAEAQKGTPGFTWKDDYRYGWSQAKSVAPTGKPFEWKIVSGAKPSAALAEWLKGLTVADCASVGAASYYQAILDDVGAEKFDAYFAADGTHALVIGQFMKRMPLNQLVFDTNKDVDLQKGDWHYFMNHPLYPKKHPAGLWSGENAIYLGDGKWGGFGAAAKTEDQMHDELVSQYGKERNGDDDAELKEHRGPDGKLPPAWEVVSKGGKIPDTIDQGRAAQAVQGRAGAGAVRRAAEERDAHQRRAAEEADGWLMDRTARLSGWARLELGRRPAFHVCGGVGLVAGAAVAFAAVAVRGGSLAAMAVVAAAAVLTFLAVALVQLAVAGEERLVYYHHEIAVLAVAAAVAAALGEPVLPLLDATALGVGAFLACGRLGCFMVGCCHGRPHRWGVRYGDRHAAAGFTPALVGVRLLPLPLIEAAIALLVVAAGFALVVAGAAAGAAFTIYVSAYAVARFFLELARGDAERPVWRGFSQPQWLSLLCAGAVAALAAAGALPWHPWDAAPALLAGAIAVLALRRRRRGAAHTAALAPAHVQELVAAVARAGGRGGPPGIVRTSLGIRVSAGPAHVTLSRDGTPMTAALAGASSAATRPAPSRSPGAAASSPAATGSSMSSWGPSRCVPEL